MKEIFTYRLPAYITSDTADKVEADLFNRFAPNSDKDIILDASELNYISSAGLRLLLKFRKLTINRITVANVNDAVIEILETTGFDSFFEIKPVTGAVASDICLYSDEDIIIYPAEDETVLLICDRFSELPDAERALITAREMQKNKLPAIISYKIMTKDLAYGVETETFEYESLKDCEADMPVFAGLLRALHDKKPDTVAASCTDIKAEWFSKLNEHKDRLSAPDYEDLYRIIDSIPSRTNFIHGLASPKNTVRINDGFAFINLQRGGYGHPIFDLIGCMELSSVRSFLEAYFESSDEDFIDKRLHIIETYRIIRNFLFADDAQLNACFEAVKNTALKEYERTIAYLNW